MKKATVIIGSARKNSNSTAIAHKFLDEFMKEGNLAEIFKLNELKYNGCIGCFACRKTGKCIQNDDMVKLLESVAESDVIVISSPVFMHQITGQVKMAIDRLYPLLGGEPGKYHIKYGEKDTIMIYSQGAPSEAVFKTMMECNEKALGGLGLKVKENLICTRANVFGVANENKELMQRAAELGRELI